MKFTLYLLILLLLSFRPLLFANDLEPVTVQLKWQHQFQFAGYYAARELGFYDQAGFNVTLLPLDNPNNSVFEQVMSGAATFGVADSTIALHRLNDEPVVVLTSVFQHSPLVFITRAEDQLFSPYELKGKRLMFQRNADDAALLATLAKMNISPDQYEFVPSNFDNLALLDPSIHAMSGYITNQPFMYQQVGVDTRVIDPANYGINFYGDLLYAQQGYVEANPARAKAFKDATLQGWQYALDHPEQVIRWIIRDYSPTKTFAELQYEADALRPIIASNLVPLGTTTRYRFERIAALYQQLELAPASGSLDGLLLEDYLTASKPQPVLSIISLGIALLLLIGLIVVALINQRLQSIVRHRTNQLRQSHEELQLNMDIINHHALVVYCDADWRITAVSNALSELFGLNQEALASQHLTLLLHPDESLLLQQTVESMLVEQKQWRGEFMCAHANGKTIWLDTRIDVRQDKHSAIVTGYIVTCFDVTDRRLLQVLSETDQLTGLANRRKLDNVLYYEWARHLRYQEQFAIILVDVDHFKSINDQFGHLEGDRILKQVANLISKTVRQVDTAARWGGEEFLILCPKTSAAGANWLAEKLRNVIVEGNLLKEHRVTASFGIASTEQAGADVDILIKQADEALYLAKNSGRNNVKTFSAAG